MKKLGLATVGVVTLKKEIIKSNDFLAAKQQGNTGAAKRVIDQVWKAKKTAHLSKHIFKDTVFLSMPSTTRTNVIPAMMAIRHSDEFSRPFVYGDDLFDVLHNTASKDIERDWRVFNARKYGVADEIGVENQLKGKKIIIVDDLITTGSSIRNFTEFLQEQGLDITHVVGLMGDRRLALDPVTEGKLKTVLQEKGVNISIENINHITRMEAGGLIRKLNRLKGKNGIKRFAKNLQRIQRPGSIKNPPGSTARRDYSTRGTNSSNEQSGKRIQAHSSSPTSSISPINNNSGSFQDKLDAVLDAVQTSQDKKEPKKEIER